VQDPTLKTPTQALQSLIEQLEHDASLQRADRVRERADALDRLEILTLSHESAAGGAIADLLRRAETLRERFEADGAALHAALRDDIRRGNGAESLRLIVEGDTGDRAPCAPGESYDFLDELLSGILELDPPEATGTDLTSEMVRYQPTPARHIFDLIARADPREDDVLVDLGSGLGHVPLLVAICTRARAVGIELEPAYVECARRSAAALRLERATFLAHDARSADFSVGTVFYLYTPFAGSILRRVLDALREEARRRTIRVCAFGPCVPAIVAEEWLELVGTAASDRLTMFRSR
jgi:hypothetical protein